MEALAFSGIVLGVVIGVLLIFLIIVAKSFHRIGPTQVGLVTKRFGRKLPDDNPIAFHGEAGHQADLLMPGARLKLWPIYSVTKFPWVQIQAGEIGVVISQVGRPLPIGAKSAHYHASFGNFSDLRGFIANGGEKGVQRPVLPPGTLMPIHPVGFLILTARRVFGLPIAPEFAALAAGGKLTPGAFKLRPEQLEVTIIAPQGNVDMIGLVTALEGEPLDSGDLASRSAGSTTSPPWRRRPRRSPTPRSSTCCWARRTTCTTTTRTSRASWTTAGASGCSTTRCCTART